MNNNYFLYRDPNWQNVTEEEKTRIGLSKEDDGEFW